MRVRIYDEQIGHGAPELKSPRDDNEGVTG